MNFMTAFLMAMLLMAVIPAASVAQSQSGGASGVPSAAIPKTTEVLVIETPKQGVTPQQIMAVIPEEIRATVKLSLRNARTRGDLKGAGCSVAALHERRKGRLKDALAHRSLVTAFLGAF